MTTNSLPNEARAVLKEVRTAVINAASKLLHMHCAGELTATQYAEAIAKLKQVGEP